MKKGDTFIGLDGKRYRVGKTVWRKDINKEIAKMTPYTPPPPRTPLASPRSLWPSRNRILCRGMGRARMGVPALTLSFTVCKPSVYILTVHTHERQIK